MLDALRGSLRQHLNADLEKASPLSGGDINEAFRLDLSDGRRVFLKTNRHAAVDMFPAEARGLAWLAEPGAIRTPEVLAVAPATPSTPGFLVLELLEPGPPQPGFDERLGRELAQLHRFGSTAFGLDHDNFIGRLPQPNAALSTWPDFYRERRLRAQLEQAPTRLVGSALRRRFDALFSRLDTMLPDEPPARLHGDLWGGNLHRAPDGAPVLIDPAAYAGSREVDLAMMRLFGGFAQRVFDAYDEVFPLADGAAERVPLYQLYPLLVHVNLFGGGYVGSVERALSRYVP